LTVTAALLPVTVRVQEAKAVTAWVTAPAEPWKNDPLEGVYTPVIMWFPALRSDLVKLAWPEPFSGNDPVSAVTPSKNCTVPVGVGPPGGEVMTWAVNVTA
jgi:hypothetical protein